MIRILFFLLASSLLGCSTSTPVHPPVELVDMENKIHIKRIWQRYIGFGASDKYLKLKPLIVGDTGYSIDHTGLVVAWNIRDGRALWQQEYQTSAATAISTDKKHLYFGTSLGEVIALNLQTGKKVWQQQLSSEILSPPVSASGQLVVRTVDGRIHALKSASGNKLWSHDRNMPTLSLRGTSTPVITHGIVVSGADNGKVTALALDNGNVLWETTVSIPRGRNEIERLIDIDADPVVKDGVIYVVAYQGRLAALKLDSGRIMWVRDVSSYSGMDVDSHKIFLSASDGNVWALDRFNGATLWKQDQLHRRRLSKPAFQGRYILVGDFNGYLHWMSREDGRLLARTQLGFSLVNDKDDEEYIEDERVFSKSRNILTQPQVNGDMAIALTREGLLSAYMVSELD
ncbi:MAG: outer membrane protein assembly factor BamB [Gammaproteobacteria bacterium]|nr:outer membrane protein assembly factor BamB [Gammaproteobacteria bacterium]